MERDRIKISHSTVLCISGTESVTGVFILQVMELSLMECVLSEAMSAVGLIQDAGFCPLLGKSVFVE